ncbi:hypothetical protein [Phormidesmis priestleyi]
MLKQSQLLIVTAVVAIVGLPLLATANTPSTQETHFGRAQSSHNTQLVAITSGTFEGRGIASGSVFTQGRQSNGFLNFNSNSNGFSLSMAATAAQGMEINYNGTITRRQMGPSGSNSFILEGQVQTFATSTNNLRVVNTFGNCRIEVFDARIISSFCTTNVPNSATRFKGLAQF